VEEMSQKKRTEPIGKGVSAATWEDLGSLSVLEVPGWRLLIGAVIGPCGSTRCGLRQDKGAVTQSCC